MKYEPVMEIQTEKGYKFTAFEAANTEHLIKLFPAIFSLCEVHDKNCNGLVFIYMDYKTAMSLPSLHKHYFVDGEEVHLFYWEQADLDGRECTMQHYWEYPDDRLKPYTGDNSSWRLIFTCGEFSKEEFSAAVHKLKNNNYSNHTWNF